MSDGKSIEFPKPRTKLFGGPDDGLEVTWAEDDPHPGYIKSEHGLYALDPATGRYVYERDQG